MQALIQNLGWGWGSAFLTGPQVMQKLIARTIFKESDATVVSPKFAF